MVYNGLKSGNWVHIFEAARQACNQLGLPVKMTQASSKESADVIMQVSTGSTTLDYDGNSYLGKALPTLLHGATRFATGQGGTEKAFASLPSQPKSAPQFLASDKVVYKEATLDESYRHSRVSARLWS